MQPTRLLAVEDNKPFQMILNIFLSHIDNLTFDIAPDGARAIELVKEKPYDVVLMDMRLPDMTGVEVSKVIKGLALDPMPRIVMTTASLDPDTYFQCRSVGIDDFALKPISIEDTRKIIEDALKISSKNA